MKASVRLHPFVHRIEPSIDPRGAITQSLQPHLDRLFVRRRPAASHLSPGQKIKRPLGAEEFKPLFFPHSTQKYISGNISKPQNIQFFQ